MSSSCQFSARFYSSLTKMVKKQMNNFVVEIWKKFDWIQIFKFIKLSVLFKPNKVLT